MTTPQSGREAFEALVEKWRDAARGIRPSGTWNGNDLAERYEWCADELEAALDQSEGAMTCKRITVDGVTFGVPAHLALRIEAALAQQGREVGEARGEKLPPFARTHEGQKVYSLAYSRGRKKGREETAAPKQQAVTDEDVRWCRDIAGDLREAGGPTNAMRLVALERLIRAALAGKTEVGRG